MKKIFLIGDSIRVGFLEEETRKYGYGFHIQKKLAGKAEVYNPSDNCRFLQYVLRYLHEWKAEVGAGEDIDIVHWNTGLWDVLRLFGDECLTPIEEYKKLLVRVLNQIHHLFPKAKVYFSLSTPVMEEMASADFNRRNEDIQRYNAAATEILSPLGVEIIDLYTKAKTLQPQYSRDWVHYNEEGASILADFIIQALDL